MTPPHHPERREIVAFSMPAPQVCVIVTARMSALVGLKEASRPKYEMLADVRRVQKETAASFDVRYSLNGGRSPRRRLRQFCATFGLMHRSKSSSIRSPCRYVAQYNNNAEHAIKAFARLRDVISGLSTKKGVDEYVTLLSVAETCKYRGIDFLDFLRSGEKDVAMFAPSRRRSK